MRGFLAFTLFLFFPNNAILVEGSSTATAVGNFEASLLGRNADPLVTAAPLVIGTTCQDGCVLLAVHTMFAQEPLLLDTTDAEDEGLQDLPKEYRGPFRVFSVDSYGTSLACVGWRADAQTLVNYCKHLAKEDVALYGNGRQVDSEYGNYLATEASTWLARSAVSGKIRPLSCAGLLATGSIENSPGSLWLVDITGSYPIRAHAIGGGPLAGIVNDYLATIDFANLKHERVIKLLMEFVSELDGIPKGSRIEVVSIGGQKGGKRHLLSRIPN
ncbi:unnamed protein product [Cylindrotheca closterium]|uniref:Uncharacterized protein n=1 Tax=Cylindrotheca closterium TaxID=2856 RepID=A0AAD2FBW0_9STRA|nr:unnamed protein product [Cylindrotheca closterium]